MLFGCIVYSHTPISVMITSDTFPSGAPEFISTGGESEGERKGIDQ